MKKTKTLWTLLFYQDIYNYINRNTDVTMNKMCKFFNKDRQAIQLSLNIMRDLGAPLYYDNRLGWKVVDTKYIMNYNPENLRVLLGENKY